MSGELDSLWEEHTKLREKHEALHIDHTDLKGKYDMVQRRFDSLEDTIAHNEQRRAEWHEEVLAALTGVTSSINALKTAEDERAGMAKLGRMVAAIAVFVLTSLGIYSWISNFLNTGDGNGPG